MPKKCIRWEINDSYAGGHRPQYTTFHTEDWDEDWELLTEEEQEDILCEVLDEAMRNIGYSIMEVTDAN